jgi:D-3-phosphoglycerate dehydrogenase
MKITIVEPLGISKAGFEKLKEEFEASGNVFSYYMHRNEDAEVLVERMKDADIVVISNIKLTAEVLGKCPNLKMLSVAFTGLDHIDLDYCKQKSIDVFNASGYSTVAVAELAIGLMLDVYRKITEMDATTRNLGGRGMFLGRELHGKTVGVVGTGAIGLQTIRLLLAFGCNVIAYSRTEKDEAKAWGVRYVSLDTLMAEADIVTLHVPATKETSKLIDADKIALMKPTAVLINTARGAVVDNEALAFALKEGKIAGAGIDVYENEPPLAKDYALLSAPNAVLLPHVAYATREAFDIRADIVMNTVRKWIKGNL